MKINSVALSAVPSYKTAFVSIAHLSPADSVNLAGLSRKGYYFCHNVSNDGSGFIVRFGQVTPDAHEMPEFLVSQYDFSQPFAELMQLLADAGFDAVHFDPEMDLIEGVTWYTDNGTKVVPLVYGAQLTNYYDLTEEERQIVLSTWPEHLAQDKDFIFVDGAALEFEDCMRIESNSEMAEYGFTGYWSESNTSALYCVLSDDAETVDVVRVS